MSEYLDFQLVISPNIQHTGTWDILLKDCPVAGLAGTRDTVQPAVKQSQLDRLRDRNGWPNSAELKAIGQDVWQSFMTPQLRVAFISCLAKAKQDHCGLRITVTIKGEESDQAIPGKIRLQELPIEAMYDNAAFLAPNPLTPVSRLLVFEPDIDPLLVSLPLHILAVVATPNDKPPANFAAEKSSLEDALKPLRDAGSVKLEFCEPATIPELMKQLEKGFQILHFIGHGAYDVVDNDPSPRPHLCFMGPDGNSDPVDGEKLSLILQNNNVRLMVISACSSAAPTPKEVQETVGPFDGVAQNLIAGISGVSAVVAMQFDIENQAAETFSKTFYTQLLSAGRTLDEIVALGRKAVIAKMNTGHRAWVTPVLYWRSKGCKVFEIDPGTAKDPKIQVLLNQHDTAIQSYLRTISDAIRFLAHMPGQAILLTDPWRKSIEDLQKEKCKLQGDVLRLIGDCKQPGCDIQCRLIMSLQTPTVIGDVKVNINYPIDKASYKSVTSGTDTPGNFPLASNQAAGTVNLFIQNASGGNIWEPGEYELAVLSLQLVPGNIGHFEVSMADIRIDKGGTYVNDSVNAIVYAIP